MTIYSTKVNEVGPNALDFLEQNMMVLFGKNAPQELKPYCFLVDVNELQGDIQTGDYFTVDNEKYKITAVGAQVEKNLNDMGHITVSFSGETEAELAGTLYVEHKEIKPAAEGTDIGIVEN